MHPKIKSFYDADTHTLSYIVYDENNTTVLIDPVLNYDPAASKISRRSVNEVVSFIRENNLDLQLILETHAHADHITGSEVLKEIFPRVRVGISENIREVQKTFKKMFNITEIDESGSQFDLLLKNGEILMIGDLSIKVLFTPGHTPACASFLIGNNLFTGDALFMPDFGTGRCDFPGGSSEQLYYSIHETLYSLPDETKVYVGHDYQPGGRELKYETTIGESKRENIQLKASTSESEFVSFRESRDKTLSAPKLLLQSIQLNINSGKIPEAESNGMSYIKMPLSLAED